MMTDVVTEFDGFGVNDRGYQVEWIKCSETEGWEVVREKIYLMTE